jgi:hypothetical protein
MVIMKIAVTGHRPQRLNGQEAIVGQWLYDEINKLQKTEKITAAYNEIGRASCRERVYVLV